jgi:glycosyltransferase involved in cell wall biosynthesis
VGQIATKCDPANPDDDVRAVLRANQSDCVDSVTYLRELPTKAPTSRDLFHSGWAKALIDIAQKSKARVLQPTTDFPNGRAALAASAELKLPVVYEVRGFLEESAQARRYVNGVAISEKDEKYDLVRQAETNVMIDANAVTTLSETMKTEIAKRGVDARKIHVMPNGVPAELLTTRTDTSSLRARLGIKNRELVVGVVTTFAAHEGLSTLVSAIELLKSRNLPIKCVMVGSGPTWHATKRLVTERGLGDWVHLPGRVSPNEVAQWYQLLDLFVLPRVDSRVTQLVTPLKPLEAMALGVPVLGSDVAGVSEVVVNGVTGVLFEPENPAECALKIEELLYDSSTRDELADAGRAWVAQQRTWAMIAKRYVSLYQELGAI